MKKQFKLLNYKFDTFTRTLPDPIRPLGKKILGWGKTTAALLLSRDLFLYELPLENDPATGRIGYLGPGPNLPFIAHQVGSSEINEQRPQWQTPWWRVRTAIEQAQAEYDSLIVELPQRMLTRLNLAGGIFTLPYLRWGIETHCSWTEVQENFRTDARYSLRQDYGVEIKCSTTTKKEDLLYFYNDIYYPYITQRFGELAQPSSLDELRYYFQRGWLILAKNEKEEVLGGAMCFVINDIMYDYVHASVAGLDNHLQRGVTANFFGYMIRLAWEKKCRYLDLGHTRPLLDDGIARYKRKWGAYVFADFTQNWGLWISGGRSAPKTAHLLARHPWIWLDKAGRLQGLVVKNRLKAPLNAAQVKKYCKKLWTPGLAGITLAADKGFAPDVPLVESPIPAIGPATRWPLES